MRVVVWASLVAPLVTNLPATRETQVRSLGSGRSPGEGNSNPLQYFCLEDPIDRGDWRATVHGLAKIRTRLQLTLHFTLYIADRLHVQSLAMFEMECDSLRAAQVYASGSLGFSLSSVSK